MQCAVQAPLCQHVSGAKSRLISAKESHIFFFYLSASLLKLCLLFLSAPCSLSN